MKKIEYLSPSSYMSFLKDAESFYLDRLADNRPARMAQTQPMSVGSAFDAYAKSYLYEAIYGVQDSGKFNFSNLFESQVEEQNRDWAVVAGKYAFDCYQRSGALADLLADLKRASGIVRFEDSVEGVIGGVPLLGKPDCYYINGQGHPVVLDWKVNGFCGKSNTSPKPGYVRLRTCHEDVQRNSPIRHKACWPKEHKGVTINGATTLDAVAEDWATQVAIYAWLLDAPVGGDFIVAIDQLACAGNGTSEPDIRIAEHRLLINESFQKSLLSGLQSVWKALDSGHIFMGVSRAESDKLCAQLEDRAAGLAADPMLAAMTRSHRNW